MFERKDIKTPRMTEVEIYFKGSCGRKGEELAKRRKPSKEEMDAANHRHRIKKIRWKIQANFRPDDLFLTLKPRKGCGWTLEDLIEARIKFIRVLKTLYKKHGVELKYIYRQEIGERGGLHFHLLVNDAGISLSEIKGLWQKYGGYTVNAQPLRDEGGYEDLAEYIVKEPPAKIKGQITMDSYKLDKLSRYGCSRNLIEPETETKVYTKKTVEEIIRYGVKADEGYYLDKDSVYIGVNPYTGYSYIFYRQHKIRSAEDMKKQKTRVAPVQDDKLRLVDEYKHKNRITSRINHRG